MMKSRKHRVRLSLYLIVFMSYAIGFSAWANPSHLQQKSGTITGKVQDLNGEPLVGVTVSVVGTSVGTITDVDGRYTVGVSGKGDRLQFTYVGYATQTVKIDNRQVINVILNEDDLLLEEVVVVGFGKQKKGIVTGSVASVTTKDLLQSPQANISNALAGRLPGLLSVQRSGEPGKDASTLRIRGVGTFAGGDSQDPLIMVDGIESSNYNDIDPSEIESLTVLKDASATAVYGVRGANGVILITTRRGVEGKPKVSLSSNMAITNFPFLRESMNSYEYASSYNRALAHDSYITNNYIPEYSDEELRLYRSHEDPMFYPDMDWYDYMLKDYSYQTQTNFNIGGGTKSVKYFVSLGYFTQEGMLNDEIYDPGYDYQVRYRRYNLRSNFDINVTKDLLASFDLSTQMGDYRNPNWSMGGLMEMLSSVKPLASPGVIDNKIITIPAGSPPVIAFDKGWSRNYENNLKGSVRLNYKMDYLLKGFALRGAVQYSNYNSDNKKYNLNGLTYSAQRVDGEIVLLASGDPSPMQFSWGINKNTRIYMEGGAEYAQQFGDHQVSGLVLYNQSKYYSPNLAFLVPNGYQGLVGRVTYNFKNRYLAEFNIGYNGTENFAKGSRFGTFPAYSLGWVVSEESFFPKSDKFNFIKVRGSYGEVGNDKIGGDRFLYRPTAYGYQSNVYYFGEQGSSRQGVQGSLEGKMGNPVLTWERAKKMNLGADLKLWNNKLDVTFDFFEEKRDNILWNRGTVPVIMGAEMPAYNLGKMKNSGWDGEITYTDKVDKVGYFIKGNYTFAHNVIEYQDEVPRNYPYLYRTGHRYGQFFGYVAEGLYNTWEEVNDVNRPVYQWSNNKIQPGDIKYVDINGDGRITDDDQVPIGYSNFPEVMFGISFGANWNNFDFSVLFQGADKVSNAPSRRTTQGFYTQSGANRELLKSWTQERYEQGLEIVYPRMAADNGGHNYQRSTYWLEDASYVRLKNAEIGYTFRQKPLKRAGIGSVRLYLNGSNLITWCDLFQGEDPEYPTGEANSEPYPVTRVFNLGLNVNF